MRLFKNNSQGYQSIVKWTKNTFILNADQHKEIFNAILKESFNEIRPAEYAGTAFIGGQQGAGKCTLSQNALNECYDNAAIIDPDGSFIAYPIKLFYLPFWP